MIAAHRMGLREVILPKRNEKDIEDVPESVRNVMTCHLAATSRRPSRLHSNQSRLR
jgi:ATP-dependent Lon protease